MRASHANGAAISGIGRTYRAFYPALPRTGDRACTDCPFWLIPKNHKGVDISDAVGRIIPPAPAGAARMNYAGTAMSTPRAIFPSLAPQAVWCDNVMNELLPRFAGVELYFEDLDRAREFYTKILGLQLADEESGRYAKFDSGASEPEPTRPDSSFRGLSGWRKPACPTWRGARHRSPVHPGRR